jgi:hypothetical protein
VAVDAPGLPQAVAHAHAGVRLLHSLWLAPASRRAPYSSVTACHGYPDCSNPSLTRPQHQIQCVHAAAPACCSPHLHHALTTTAPPAACYGL